MLPWRIAGTAAAVLGPRSKLIRGQGADSVVGEVNLDRIRIAHDRHRESTTGQGAKKPDASMGSPARARGRYSCLRMVATSSRLLRTPVLVNTDFR